MRRWDESWEGKRPAWFTQYKFRIPGDAMGSLLSFLQRKSIFIKISVVFIRCLWEAATVHDQMSVIVTIDFWPLQPRIIAQQGLLLKLNIILSGLSYVFGINPVDSMLPLSCPSALGVRIRSRIVLNKGGEGGVCSSCPAVYMRRILLEIRISGWGSSSPLSTKLPEKSI